MSRIPQSQPHERGSLPVWEMVCASYRSVFIENLNHLPNAAIAPFVLSLLIGALLAFTGTSLLSGGSDGASLVGFVALIVLLLAAVAPYVLFAVTWHRLILLGSANAQPTVLPKWQDRHWRFYGYSLLIGVLSVTLLLFVVGVPLFVVYYAIGSKLLQGITAAVAFIVASTVIVRLCLVLPAIAVDQAYELGDALRSSKKQGLRMVAATLLISLPFFAVDSIANELLVNPSPDAVNSSAGLALFIVMAMIWFALHTVISYLEVAAMLTFLSLAFRRLSGWRPTDAGMSPPVAPNDAGFDST